MALKRPKRRLSTRAPFSTASSFLTPPSSSAGSSVSECGCATERSRSCVARPSRKARRATPTPQRTGRHALALVPYDESALRCLLTLLDRVGDRAGAISAFEEFSRRLSQDLGVDASADAQALVARIRSTSTAPNEIASGNKATGYPAPSIEVVPARPTPRKPLRCVRTRRSATGQQAHAAFPAPDGSFIVVANQNGTSTRAGGQATSLIGICSASTCTDSR